MSKGKPDSVDARRAAWLRDVRDRIVATVSPALQAGAAPEAISQALQTVRSLTDENIAMIEETAERKRRLGAPLPQVACKKGCDYCCTFRIRVAVPELFAISEAIAANRTEDQRTQLLKRIDEYQAQLEGLTAAQRLNKMIPCPLLEDHACSIHPVRPIACRRHHSVDVQACIEAQKHPDKVEVPHFLEVDAVVAPIMAGIQTSMKTKNLRSPMVNLAPALGIALRDSDAKQKWLRGQDVFAQAVDKGIEELAFARMKKPPAYEV